MVVIVVNYARRKERVYDAVSTSKKSVEDTCLEQVDGCRELYGEAHVKAFKNRIMISPDRWEPTPELRKRGFTFNKDARVFALITWKEE